jgi:hypothetical protein
MQILIFTRAFGKPAYVQAGFLVVTGNYDRGFLHSAHTVSPGILIPLLAK